MKRSRLCWRNPTPTPPHPSPHLYMSLSAQKGNFQSVVRSWELVIWYPGCCPWRQSLTLQPPTPCDRCNCSLSGRRQPLFKLTPSSTHAVVPEGTGTVDWWLSATDVRGFCSGVFLTLSMEPFVFLSWTMAISRLSGRKMDSATKVMGCYQRACWGRFPGIFQCGFDSSQFVVN